MGGLIEVEYEVNGFPLTFQMGEAEARSLGLVKEPAKAEQKKQSKSK